MLTAATLVAAAETTLSEIPVHSIGTIQVPTFWLPLSPLISEQARKYFVDIQSEPDFKPPASEKEFPYFRETFDEHNFASQVKYLTANFPVTTRSQVIGGISTEVVEPKEGVSKENGSRLLINLHGGGMVVGTIKGQGLAESIPIASLGKIKVVTVDYRLGPENKFPAASEDVASVYRELLKVYRPDAIGIYGCSAGGLLTAEAVAWFQTHDLPRPGAIGLFCAGAIASVTGDSLYTGPAMSGETPPSIPAPARGLPILNLYFGDAKDNDPLVSPAYFPEVLSKFPPTLLISATRDPVLSNVVYTHTQLVKVGVTADLHVWEGMTHGFISANASAPESREAWDVIVHFFLKYLGS
jgi:acetyl esterase/lipase